MIDKHQGLSVEEIVARLDDYLEVEFSFRNTRAPAESLACLPRRDQDFILDWVRRVASTNITLGFQLAENAPEALARMDRPMIEAWALNSVDTYDRTGLRAAVEALRDLSGFIQYGNERLSGAVLEEQEHVLEIFLQGLSGRDLKIRPSGSAAAYTDGETLFLPAVVAQFHEPRDNFLLFKAMVAHLWAQTRFGTFRGDPAAALARFEDPERAARLFHRLELERLDACLARELPGLAREMRALRLRLGQELPLPWHSLGVVLGAPDASARASLELVQQAWALPEPLPACYQGHLDLGLVAQTMAARLEREKARFRVALRYLGEQREDQTEKRQEPVKLEKVPDASRPEGFRLEIEVDGQLIPPPEKVQALMTSIMLDLGEIPEEYLVPAGPGEYDLGRYEEQARNPEDVWSGTYHEEGAFLYNEWDYRRRHYKKSWCVMREHEVAAVDTAFYRRTLEKHGGLVRSLRRTFELLRGEDRLLKRQRYGEDVDIDALVDAHADWHSGRELTDRLFTRMHREDRNIAVIFMVDMSGSTKGWINDAEREALILLSESLEVLGDRYAIYGFSGWARKRCETYCIKDFEAPLDERVRGRICGIEPKDYTRMGAPIRHLTEKLKGVEARIKLLVTLSDGKPDDYDLEYRGQYGIEDTRMALFEARRDGIHPYCITIDTEGKDYLPHMYGAANYVVIDDVGKLPLKVSDIYRKITS
ncbi:MAG: nitric oxide reductase activation protein [Pseudomonadota bacterium]